MHCVTTPGATVDVVVTEAGVAVNPARPEIAALLKDFGLDVRLIDELAQEAARLAPPPLPPPHRDAGRIVAVVEYRDGSVIDIVRAT